MSTSPTIVIILGLHRSGTTLLYELLASTGRFAVCRARHIIAFDEVQALDAAGEAARRRLNERFSRSAIADRGIDPVVLSPETPEEFGFFLSNRRAGWRVTSRNVAMLDALIRWVVRDEAAGGEVLLKNPWDFHRGPELLRLLPTARLIYIHRHPTHVLGSMMRLVTTVLTGDHPYLELLSERYRAYRDGTTLPRVAQWLLTRRRGLVAGLLVRRTARVVHAYMRTRDALPPDRVAELRFEDLCDDAHGTLAGLYERFGWHDPPRDARGRIVAARSHADPALLRHADLIRRRFATYAAQWGYDREAKP